MNCFSIQILKRIEKLQREIKKTGTFPVDYPIERYGRPCTHYNLVETWWLKDAGTDTLEGRFHYRAAAVSAVEKKSDGNGNDVDTGFMDIVQFMHYLAFDFVVGCGRVIVDSDETDIIVIHPDFNGEWSVHVVPEFWQDSLRAVVEAWSIDVRFTPPQWLVEKYEYELLRNLVIQLKDADEDGLLRHKVTGTMLPISYVNSNYKSA